MGFIQSNLLGLLCVACLLNAVDAIKCIHCVNAPDITNCFFNVIECGHGEQCYLEQVETSSLQRVFNGGCRSDNVCGIMTSLNIVGKRYLNRLNKRLVTCASCCADYPDDDGPCNAKLCGQSPPKVRLQQCFYCSNKASAAACKNRIICPDTQVCANEAAVTTGILIRYSYYCEDKNVCREAYSKSEQLTGRKKRSKSPFIPGAETICTSCCVGRECNKHDCYWNMRRYNSSDFT